MAEFDSKRENPTVGDISDALWALPDAVRNQVVQVIRKNLPMIPTNDEQWSVARSGSGSPGSNIERAFGANYRILFAEIRRAIPEYQSEIVKLIGSIKICGGRDHIEQALEEIG